MRATILSSSAALAFALSVPAASLAQDRCTEISIDSPTPRTAAARSAASCTGCDDEGRATITFRFDREVPCGRFVDGSPWIADDGAGVNVVEISPAVTADCGGGTCNGWMVDIASRNQAFDSRNNFDASVAPAIRNPSAAEPFVARAGNSIVKAVSFQDEVVGTGCSSSDVLGSQPRHCLYFVGALTVLGEAPPDGTGAGYFRPPYVGTERPLIAVADAHLDRLPRLPLTGFDSLPDLDVAETALCQLPMEFMGTYRQQFLKGFLNVGETRGHRGVGRVPRLRDRLQLPRHGGALRPAEPRRRRRRAVDDRLRRHGGRRRGGPRDGRRRRARSDARRRRLRLPGHAERSAPRARPPRRPRDPRSATPRSVSLATGRRRGLTRA